MLWDAGFTDRFEIIFDEQVIFGTRAKQWYPAMRHLMRGLFPDAYSIMPADISFRSDDEWAPLQAADMWAWCARHSAEHANETNPFDFLLPEFSNIRVTKYSDVFDEKKVMELRQRARTMAKNGIPSDMQDIYAAMSKDLADLPKLKSPIKKKSRSKKPDAT
jgi:hypothetical protein